METRQELNAALKAWFSTFVQEFRRQYDGLPDDAKRQLSSLGDFRNPCLVLVFWATEPQFQNILVIREPGVSTDAIKVYGPALLETMISEAESMLKDQWFDSTPESINSSLEQRYKNMVQDQLLGLLRNLPQASLRLPPRRDGSMPIMKQGSEELRYFTWFILGNLLNLRPLEFARQTVAESVAPGAVGQPAQSKQGAVQVMPRMDLPPRPSRAGFISSFYPPIWLGERHSFSFREKLDGFYVPVSSKKIGLTYKGRKLTIMLNGLLTMIEPDRETCSNLLNEIMCIALLMGVPSTAVRHDDLTDALFYDDGNWGQYSMKISERRRESLAKESSTISEDEFEQYTIISDEDLKLIVTKAETACKNADQGTFARWYIDAHTYLQDADFDHSIMKSWLIIEQHIVSMWSALPGGKRRSVGHNPKRPPDMKRTLREIFEAGKISKEEHLRLDSLRDRRNKVIHLGSTAARKEAISFLGVAEELTRVKLGVLKTSLSKAQ